MKNLVNGLNNALEMSVAGGRIFKVPDKTNENLEQPIDYRQQAIEDQERLWKREDEIRAHIEEREDTAYQRAMEDAQKAGINPNLVGLEPAQSAGGLNSASGMDYTMQSAEYNRETEKIKAKYERETQMLIQQIANEFNMKENEKDRLVKLFQTGGYVGAQLLK